MKPHDPQPTLKARARESCCAHCPPERVCAWSCVQGTSAADIVLGALLEQSDSWALRLPPEAGLEADRQALWESFNG